MTALRIARAHCANWRKNGKGCLGAIIDDDCQIRRCYPRARCVLSEPGKRCIYFEQCVAPGAPSIEDPKVRAEFEAGVRAYRLAANLPCAAQRPCPVCGQAMAPRRRFCETCARARRRQSTRRAVQRHRATGKQLRPFGPFTIKRLDGAPGRVGLETADTRKNAN